jgi:dihydroneopterin aldolase/2-amino-4-hydroxy-6-hydroxymethyldihydropteridine diphosphokinase
MDAIRLTGIQPSDVAKSNDTGDGSPSLSADVTLMLDLHEACESGDITQTVDYEQIARRVASVLQTAQRELLEATAQHVAESVLLSHRVDEVEVTIHRRRRISHLNFGEISVTITRAQSHPSTPAISRASQISAQQGSGRDAHDTGGSRLLEGGLLDNGRLHSGRSLQNGSDNNSSREPQDAQGVKAAQNDKVRHLAVIAMSTDDHIEASALFRMSIVMLDGVPGSQVIGISPLYGYQPVSQKGRSSAVVMLECITACEELQGVMQSVIRAQGDGGDGERPSQQGMWMSLLQYDERIFAGTDAGGADSVQNYPEVRAAWAELSTSVQHDTPSVWNAYAHQEQDDVPTDHPAVSKLSDDWILGGMA